MTKRKEPGLVDELRLIDQLVPIEIEVGYTNQDKVKSR
jgi:hypothetical protein